MSMRHIPEAEWQASAMHFGSVILEGVWRVVMVSEPIGKVRRSTTGNVNQVSA